MTPFSSVMSNGTWATIKRIAATVVGSALLFLAGAVLKDSNRITALEVRIDSIYRELKTNGDRLESNRIENRDEHREIIKQLGDIAKEVRR